MTFYAFLILLSLSPSFSLSPPPPLPLSVHECRNIPPMDANGLADPYVKLRLHPDSSSAIKQKTEKKQNTLNPKFEEDFF